MSGTELSLSFNPKSSHDLSEIDLVSLAFLPFSFLLRLLFLGIFLLFRNLLLLFLLILFGLLWNLFGLGFLRFFYFRYRSRDNFRFLLFGYCSCGSDDGILRFPRATFFIRTVQTINRFVTFVIFTDAVSTVATFEPPLMTRMLITVLLVAHITTIISFVAVKTLWDTHPLRTAELVGPTRRLVAVLLVGVVVLSAIFLPVTSIHTTQTRLADGTLEVGVGTSIGFLAHRSVSRRFVAIVVTVVGFVARPCFRDTLSVLAPEVDGEITRSYRRRTAVFLVGSITAVILPVTSVRRQDTVAVTALKLLFLALLRGSNRDGHVHKK